MRDRDEKEGTDVKPSEHNAMTQPPRTGFFATFCAFLGGQGSGAPRGPLAAALVLAAFAFALPVTPALASSPPQARLELAAAPDAGLSGLGPPAFRGELKYEEVFATRARIVAVARIGNVEPAPEVKWSGEYATSEMALEEGKGTVAGGETVFKNEIAVGLGADDATTGNHDEPESAILHHLAPGTTYYARFHVEDEGGEAEATFKFATTAIARPEVATGQNGGTTFHGGASGPTSAGFTAQIESNGAATGYGFEYTTEPGSPGSWKLFTSGATGTISVAEDFANPEAKLTGLKPETTYFVRLKASNAKGETIQRTYLATGNAELESFTTPTGKPVAFEPRVSTVTGTSAKLIGSLLPRGSETEWRFQFTTEPENPASWVNGPEGVVSQAEAEALLEGVDAPGIEGTLSGLKPETVYYVRLFAKNTAGEAETCYEAGPGPKFGQHICEPISAATVHGISSFETAGAPSASASVTHGVHGGSLRLLGSVGPHGYDTHYRFEYVTQAQFEHAGFAEALSTSEQDAGGGGSDESMGHFTTRFVGEDLPGLQAGETYRYRLVATNASPGNPVIDSAEESLMVPTAPPPGPEEVCPNRALRTGPSANLPDCRAYEQLTPVDKEGSREIFQYDGLKSPSVALVGEDGDILMLNAEVVWSSLSSAGQGPYFFSRTPAGWEVSAATVQPQAGIETYAPQVFSADLTQFAFESGFATSSGGSGQSKSVEFKAGVPGGTYVTAATVPRSEVGSPGGWVAASADASKLILQVEDRKLVEPASTTKSGFDLYEYAQGKLSQVNVGIGSCGANIARGNEEAGGSSSPHAVSADGSRVFFEAVPGSACSAAKHVYVRVNGVETLDLGAYRFAGASADGSEVLLAQASGEKPGLYLYQNKTTKPLASTGSIAGTSFTVSKDLKAIYFASGAASESDIYRYDVATETLGFVLQSDEAATYEESYLSPDGRYYYFASRGVAGLPGGATAPDGGHEEHPIPLSSLPLEPTEQVYRYDSVEHAVECISCASASDPEPKLGANFGKADAGQVLAGDGLPTRRLISANGDFAFFKTSAALVPADVDGEVTPEGDLGVGASQPEHASSDNSVSGDVYEWRRDGVDGCREPQGCVALITNGRGGVLNLVLGSSEDGRDVFLYTHSQLVGQDNDTAGDIYDARIGGGFPSPPPRPVECEGDACSTPVSAPNDATPSSSTFNGAGNVLGASVPVVRGKSKAKAKAKCNAKARAKCKSKARKMRKRAKKAGNKRRQKR